MMNNIIMKVRTFMQKNKDSGGNVVRQKVTGGLVSFCRGMLLFSLCFMIIEPLLNKMSLSFMQERDLYDATVISIPRNFTTNNYSLAANLMNYSQGLVNTLGICLLISVLQISTCTLVAYGFARFKFPFKKILFGCVMLTIIIPPQTIMTALYLNFRYFDLFGLVTLVNGSSINLLNTVFPYLMLVAGCMGLKSGLYVYMIRQYFRGMPKELEEAAYVDGCSPLRTFVSIMLPDALPILTSCFLFSFVWQWTDSFYSSLFLRNMVLLSSGLGSIVDRLTNYYSNVLNGVLPGTALTQTMISTGMLMCIVPLIILFLIAQKGFVESVSQSGLKM